MNALFGYKPKNEDVELVKKGLCPSCKIPWRENHICLEERNEETATSAGKDKITILTDDGYQHNEAITCSIENQPGASLNKNMDQIASTDECSDGEGQGEASTAGCPFLYVGDIEIPLGETTASTSSHESEKDEYFAVEEEVPRSISPSPHELHEVDPMLEEEKAYFQEPSLLKGHTR